MCQNQIEKGVAELKFDTKVYDFKTSYEHQSINFIYTFKNLGNETLVINDLKSSCVCIKMDLSKTQFEPGESGEIKGFFNPIYRGTQEGKLSVKKITISANTVPSKTFLQLKGVIQTDINRPENSKYLIDNIDYQAIEFRGSKKGNQIISRVKLIENLSDTLKTEGSVFVFDDGNRIENPPNIDTTFTGVFVKFNSGVIVEETMYIHGVRNGLFRKYSHNGDLLKRGTYKIDNLDGLLFIYDKKGRILLNELYEEGRMINYSPRW